METKNIDEYLNTVFSSGIEKAKEKLDPFGDNQSNFKDYVLSKSKENKASKDFAKENQFEENSYIDEIEKKDNSITNISDALDVNFKVSGSHKNFDDDRERKATRKSLYDMNKEQSIMADNSLDFINTKYNYLLNDVNKFEDGKQIKIGDISENNSVNKKTITDKVNETKISNNDRRLSSKENQAYDSKGNLVKALNKNEILLNDKSIKKQKTLIKKNTVYDNQDNRVLDARKVRILLFFIDL